MAKTGDDCFYFYSQTCIKGAACPFRHVEEAKSSSVTCDDWRMNRCMAQPCLFRHMELKQNTPCFYETQPGGCTKPNCKFRHNFPKHTEVPPMSAATVPPVTTLPGNKVAQPAIVSGQVPVIWNRPWHGPNVLPQPHAFPGAPLSGPVRPGPPGFPVFGQAGPGNIPMMKIEPVIINPNEESDQDSIKGSPMKQPQRSVVSTTTSAPSSVQSSNPLDYFLNAKPWVDPNPRKVCSRDPSPGRVSPYRRQGSVSPSRSQSPRRSVSPVVEGRRRSVSAERYSSGSRRRSNSLDRSRSPEWRDRRRFGRRSSRSPQRRRSRSPEGSRGVGILGRFRTGTRGTKLEEVKVTGSKVISIKKEKKEKEDQDGEKEKQDDKSEDKVRVKGEPSKAAPVIKEEVKSLEDIYRERALQSLMEAKRKKILENKRKRWEKVDASKKSESDKSDKEAGEETKAAVDEKGDNQDKVDSSSDSPDDEDGNKSEDLPDDIDIELGEGELESDKEESANSEAESDKEVKSDTHQSEEESSEKVNKRTRSSITIPTKPSIKSRLGLKTASRVPQESRQDISERSAVKRSIKDRLGFKPSQGSDNPLRTGVIKLSRHSRSDNVLSRIGITREIRERKREGKSILMLPQITVKNEVDIEDRKAGLKQRLGLLDDEADDSDSKKDRKRKRGIDEELMKLLHEEEADIDEEDLELLSKKEKKKLLKKLLVQQGREEEYEAIRKKKKRGFKKKKERIDEEGDRNSRRRINVQERLGRKEEAEEVVEDVDAENLPSEDEIELEEVAEEPLETSPEQEAVGGSTVKEAEETKREISVKSLEEKQREKADKDARLREALEPKSLEDIRRERALKKSIPGEGGMMIAAGHNRRKIVLEEEQEAPKDVDPPVRVTFSGREFPDKRKLIRLGKNQEQNENDQPSETKSVRIARRERQIYVPPTVKRTEAPVVLSRSAGPPKGREIVDYGDMFPKKSTSADDVEKKKIRLISSASESDLTTRPRLTLQKGPPKVEVKDATVKTFAEIMAEKKRKRLLAQQGKPYTPVVFNEPEPSSSAQGSKSVSIEDRLSPISTEPQVTSVTTSSVHIVPSPVKTQTLTKSASSTSVQAENKPTRWKRRKINNPEVLVSDDSNLSQESVSIKDTQASGDSTTKSSEKLEKVQEPESAQKSSPSTVKKEISVDESKPSAEKKKKMSDSFMDFEDDILNFEDNDIDLELEAGHQDADELMREIDELLS